MDAIVDMSLAELPAPPATRLRRPGWRDPRLLVGIVMVAASVALGAWVVRSAQATVPVFAARHAIVAGDAVRADDLVVVRVRGVDLGHYLRADRPFDDGVAVRTVGAGELVPRAALGDASTVDARSVAVPLTSSPSKDVKVGALVDLWFAPKAAAGATSSEPAPRALATGLTVAEVSSTGGAFGVGAGGGPTIHVLVPSGDLGPVLAALASDGAVDVVPVPGSGG